MARIQTAAPTSEPLTLADVKTFVRQDQPDDDGLLALLIGAARRRAEALTGRALMPQAWRYTLPTFTPDGDPYAALFLGLAPLQSVGPVTYYDADNELRELAGVAMLADDTAPLLLAPAGGWPITYDRPDAVSITVTAGYFDADRVPEDIRAWLLLRIGTAYERRDALVSAPGGLKELPRAHVDGLLDPYAVGWL